jgi:hypothetical protein
MSLASRKLIALLLVIFLIMPLAFATLTLFSINSWVLDRGFYVNLLDDPRLYEALLSQDLPLYLNARWFPHEINTDLPPAALDQALREVITPPYLHDQALRVVNQTFDTLEGNRAALDIDMDFAPIKAVLHGEGGLRFARVLATQLPACATGQAALAADSTLIRCRTANVSVEDATQQINLALPAFINKLPDQISLSRDPLALRGGGYWFSPMFFGTGGLNIAIGLMLVVMVGAWFSTAFIGGVNRRERLLWLGWSLLGPALLILISGIVISSPLTAYSIRFGLDETRLALEDVQFSVAFRQALIEITSKALNTVGGGFLSTGAASAAIALGLVIWGANSRSEQRVAAAVTSTPLIESSDPTA